MSSEWPTAPQLIALSLLADGKNNELAGIVLGVSASAVKQRMMKLRNKFGFETNEHAMAEAFRRGWLT